MTRRILTLFLSFAIIISACTAFAVNAQEESGLTLKYDDRYSFEGKEIKAITDENVTSYQVGYGVDENALDTNVLRQDETDKSKVIAAGVGTAKVEFADGSSVDVTVEPADLSIIFFIGQSNGEGCDGTPGESVEGEDGTSYTSFAPSDSYAGVPITGMQDFTGSLSVDNAASFIASSLTGDTALNGDKLIYPTYAFCESGSGKAGLDSAAAYKWHELTGEKAWIVNAAHHGTSITLWNPDDANKRNELYQAIEVFKNVKITAEKEFKAGHYNCSKLAYMWFQGESDQQMSAEEYTERYLAMHDKLKEVMTLDVNGKTKELDYGTMILPRIGNGMTDQYTIIDVKMNGQRLAHYYLANNPEYKDILMLSNIGDSWVDAISGSNRGVVEKYFDEHYPDHVLDYPTQNGVPNSIPEKAKDIHAYYHYSQVGYNEIGFEYAQNLATVFGYTTSEKQAEIKVLSGDGYNYFSDDEYFLSGTEFSATPVIDPLSGGKVSAEVQGDVEQIGIYQYKISGEGQLIYTLENGTKRVVNVHLYNYGDVNSDGKITANDVLLIRKHIAGQKVNIVKLAADANGNGKITASDVLLVREYAAGQDVEFGASAK